MDINKTEMIEFLYYLIEKNKLGKDDAKNLKNALEKYIGDENVENNNNEDVSKNESINVQSEKNDPKSDENLKKLVDDELKSLLSSGMITPDDMERFGGKF